MQSTLIKAINEMPEFKDKLGFSISHTTRGPREGETDGVDYHFVDVDSMKVRPHMPLPPPPAPCAPAPHPHAPRRLQPPVTPAPRYSGAPGPRAAPLWPPLSQKDIADGKFIEHAEVHGNFYGTSKAAVEAVTATGKVCILDIDVQGAKQVRAAGQPALFVFVEPDSMENLETRLRGRATDAEDVIQRRLANAQGEIDASKEAGLFDFRVVNSTVDEAAGQIAEVVRQCLNGGAKPAKTAKKAAPAAADPELVVPAVEGDLPADTRVVFVLGGPGSGKGTQCDKILKDYEVKHLSAGDLLREEVASGSSIGAALEATMKEGKLVPMSVTITLLKNAMIKSGASTFLIDGFPRAMDQGEAFESGIVKCAGVLFYDCPEDVMRARLLERGKTSGRADDNEETIVKRFRTFVESSMPVIDHYKGEGKCHHISAVPTPDEVYAETSKALDAMAVPKKAVAGANVADADAAATDAAVDELAGGVAEEAAAQV